MTGGQPPSARRIALLLVSVFFVAPTFYVGYSAVQTLRMLTEVERERDTWQQPSDILRGLNLTAGGVVLDLGCGAGYFALKLSPIVGPDGAVLAEDIRRESLAFLYMRRFTRGAYNVRIVEGDTDDPRLPPVPIDAALIANTYHELQAPRAILTVVHRAMRSGGRLVVVDRGPRSEPHGLIDDTAARHERRPGVAADEIQEAGFVIVSRDDRFINRAGDDDLWWLIVARKP